MDKIKTAKKNLYKMGVENSGKEETIKGLKKAFGGRKSPISKVLKKETGEKKEKTYKGRPIRELEKESGKHWG